MSGAGVKQSAGIEEGSQDIRRPGAGIVYTSNFGGDVGKNAVQPLVVAISGCQKALGCHLVPVAPPRRHEGGDVPIVFVDGD